MKDEGTMAETSFTDLCFGCKAFKEIVYTEGGTARPFCAACTEMQPPTSDEIAVLLLTAPWSPYGPPFRNGDVVQARAGAFVYDGTGVITDISMSLENGATPIYPTWLVVFTSKASDDVPDQYWYPEVCLKLISRKPTTGVTGE